MFEKLRNSWSRQRILGVGRGASGSEDGLSDEDAEVAFSGSEDEDLQSGRRRFQLEAGGKQRQANAKNEKAYDKRRSVQDCLVNIRDIVMRADLQKSRKLAGGKLKPKTGGPYEVIRTAKTAADIREIDDS